jgi:primosomal protein N' (replication factor Y)
VFVGTEAVLHRIQRRVARVVFLEFDQELLAPRMRAAEEAMALLIRAARLLGHRSDGGRLVVQTRQPGHEVLQAVLHADPAALVAAERDRRSVLGLPPFAALARISGVAAPEFMAHLAQADGMDVMGPRDGAWLVRAPDHDRLSDALLAVERPPGRLRLEVDPLRA